MTATDLFSIAELQTMPKSDCVLIINGLHPFYDKKFDLVKHQNFDESGDSDKGKKFDKFFALAIFFPCAPDDVLCMIAGLTKMSWKKFSAIILLGKPASIAAYSMALIYAGGFLGKLIA